MTHPTIPVLERHLLLYRSLWRASVFSFFILPALFLASIGFGVGTFVGDVAGVPYLAWIAPGLLAMTILQIGVNESTFGIFTDFEWIGVFHVMRNTRVRIRDMIGGWLLYVIVVAELATFAFLAVAFAFGIRQPLLWLAGPLVGILIAISVAAPTTAFSATIRDDGNFPLLNQLAVVPMSLISGVYFPIDRLPAVLRPVSYLSPLWHGVELLRNAALARGSVSSYAVHCGYLLVWAFLGFRGAHVAFRRRLAG